MSAATSWQVVAHGWTIGRFDANGSWQVDSIHSERDRAEDRCASLNGERQPQRLDTVKRPAKRRALKHKSR